MKTLSRRVTIPVFAALALAHCCPPWQPGCCTVPGTTSYVNARTGGSNPDQFLDELLDAGIPMDVVFSGAPCVALCGHPAARCFYGPFTCADEANANMGPSFRCRPVLDGQAPIHLAAEIVLRCTPALCAPSGRRSYSSSPEHHSDTLPDYLSSLAALEHESITAFTEMASFLAIHGAPASLLARLEVAAADEARHTHAILTLARHAANTHVVLRDTPASHPASLFAFALHNAREGCVRETYGASLAHYQSQHATDPFVRDTFATIAIEESQHAQLSWDVAQWVDTLLTESERALVAHAILEATEDLAQSLAQPSPREWRDTLGLPSADVALAMHQQLRRALWSEHAAS